MSPEGKKPLNSHASEGYRARRALPRRAIPAIGTGLHPRSAAGRALRLAEAIRLRYAGLGWRPGYIPLFWLNRPTWFNQAPPGPTNLEINLNFTQRASLAGLTASIPWLTFLRSTDPGRSSGLPGRQLVRPEPRPEQANALPTVQRLVEQHTRVETALRYRPADLSPVNRLINPLTAAVTRPGMYLPTPESQPPRATAVTRPGAYLPTPESQMTPARTTVHPLTPELQPSPIQQAMHASVLEVQPPALRQARPSSRPAIAEAESSAIRPGSTRNADLPASSQTPPLPLDLNHLTDQVIQTIDRRIIANRERLGRI